MIYEVSLLFTLNQTEHKGNNYKNCDKSFSQAITLKMHTHILHEDHKHHKCDSCDKSFSQAGSLKTHVEKKHK